MVLAHDLYSTKRTQDIRTNQDVLFDALLLSERTLQGLTNAGFYKPSPVQVHGIPMGKCGFDLLLEAKSGTGKTIVFTVIALEKLDLEKGLQVIMLAPTREIASQIHDVIKSIGSQYLGLCVEVVMGGLPIQDDIKKFKIGKKVHIVVGSPGRLRHLIQTNHIDASAVRLLVLDEADKLIEKSFQPDINFIFSSLPNQKQVIMSSATFSDSATEFISKYVREPQHICPDSTSVLLGIEQKVSLVTTNANIVKQTYLRYAELMKILTNKDFKQSLIFCNYQARVADLYKLLTRDKWPCEQLYGSQHQTDRLDALKTLQEYKCRILISTDLAARGIDASNVDLVINFEPPYDWQTYLHRIGRAGRYGSYGTAVSIVAMGKEEIKFKEILSIMKESLNITYYWGNTKYDLNNENGDIKEPKNGILHEHINGESEKVNNGVTNNCIIKENNKRNVTTNSATNKSMFEYLWGPNNNKKAEIETFNELAKSFNDSQSINKFDDLLQSLENHDLSQDGKDDATQKLLKIQIDEDAISKCINHLNISHENHNQLPQSSNQDAENHEDTRELMEPLITNGNALESDKDNNNLKNLFYKNDKEENDAIKPHYTKQNTKHYNSNQIPYDDDSDESLNEEQSEMIRLGLPTSFYSKADKDVDKKQNIRKKPFKRVENNRPSIREHIDCDDTRNHCISDTTQSKRSSLLDTNTRHNHKLSDKIDHSNELRVCEDTRIANDEFKYNKNNVSSKQPETSNHRYKNRAQNSERDHKTVNTKSEKSNKVNKKSNKLNKTSEDEYTLWYNALKLRTLQWEQIFYMEEISQIRF